jgi:2-polyprenyl-3-methyl-5-hydroxy-6-metoxy-1,4-benzoquinol methylase
MRLSRGLYELGIVVGNTYDKYGSKNPIERLLLHKFQKSLQEILIKTDAVNIHEVGCGEGYWVLKWLEEGRYARGSDFSINVIDMARLNAIDKGLSADFKVASIYELSPKIDAADVVVCCEVLEHLEKPEYALEVLSSLAKPYLIVSVPREPIWSILNIARGKYIADFGNTPGHIQRWSRMSFLRLIDRYFHIIEVRTPIPWTMALCKARNSD